MSGTNHQPEIKVTDAFRQSSSTIILASLDVSSANESISNKQNDLPKLMINMFENPMLHSPEREELDGLAHAQNRVHY